MMKISYFTILLVLMFLAPAPLLAGGTACKVEFHNLSYQGDDRFLLSLTSLEDCYETAELFKKNEKIKLLLRYEKTGLFEHTKNRARIRKQDFLSSINYILREWIVGEQISFGLMGQGLVESDKPEEYDAISNGLKVHEGVVFSYD